MGKSMPKGNGVPKSKGKQPTIQEASKSSITGWTHKKVDSCRNKLQR